MKESNLESSCHKISISFSMYLLYFSFDTSFDHSIYRINARQRSYPHILFIRKMVHEDKENLNLYNNLTT